MQGEGLGSPTSASLTAVSTGSGLAVGVSIHPQRKQGFVGRTDPSVRWQHGTGATFSSSLLPVKIAANVYLNSLFKILSWVLVRNKLPFLLHPATFFFFFLFSLFRLFHAGKYATRFINSLTGTNKSCNLLIRYLAMLDLLCHFNCCQYVCVYDPCLYLTVNSYKIKTFASSATAGKRSFLGFFTGFLG